MANIANGKSNYCCTLAKLKKFHRVEQLTSSHLEILAFKETALQAFPTD